MATEICSAGTLASRLRCIATYGGHDSSFDVVLNYALVCLNVCLLLLGQNRDGGQRLWLCLFFVLFQFALCLAVGCAGVSIVWCAAAGVAFIDCAFADAAAPRLLAAPVFVFDAAAIAYYAATAVAVTTLAHVCALFMGATLSLFLNNRRSCLGALCVRRAGADGPWDDGRPLVSTGPADEPPRHS
ncbi:hypothetical protein M885DRAFT_619633 [Pelagophyceae sp. CCMP2097]|nr:hypothetical protein M885DRAFT_619633 [Pelagophyceae sp. CCMP2097]